MGWLQIAFVCWGLFAITALIALAFMALGPDIISEWNERKSAAARLAAEYDRGWADCYSEELDLKLRAAGDKLRSGNPRPEKTLADLVRGTSTIGYVPPLSRKDSLMAKENSRAYYAILEGDTVVETWATLPEGRQFAKARAETLAAEHPGTTYSIARVNGAARVEPKPTIWTDYE